MLITWKGEEMALFTSYHMPHVDKRYHMLILSRILRGYYLVFFFFFLIPTYKTPLKAQACHMASQCQ